MEGTSAAMSFTDVFGWIGEGMETILGLCTKFPLNIFIGSSVIFIGVRIYRKLKH